MQNENSGTCECPCKNTTDSSTDFAENFHEKNDWWFALAIAFILLWFIVVPIVFFCRTMRTKKQKLILKKKKRRRGRKARAKGGRLTKSTYITKSPVNQTKIVDDQAKSTKLTDIQTKLTAGVMKKRPPSKGDFERKSTNKVAA